jgi:hypothetical protein
MKERLPYIALGVVVLALGGWAWYYWFSPSGGGSTSGFPMSCPGCGAFFTLSEDELTTHPKGPNGEGFKCEKCGKFGAAVASKCDKCGQWMIPVKGEGGVERCPKCNK